MNVACPECRSVFRVDPAKVPFGGVRARCSACGGVIPVPAAPEESSTPASAASAEPPRPVPPPLTPSAEVAQGAPALGAVAPVPVVPPMRPTVAQPLPQADERTTAVGPVLRPTAAWRAPVTPATPVAPAAPAAASGGQTPLPPPPGPGPAIGGMMAGPTGAAVPRLTPWPAAAPAVPPAVSPLFGTSGPASPRSTPPGVAFGGLADAPAPMPAAPQPTEAAAAAPAPPAVTPALTPAAPRRHVNPFLSADPEVRARRLARALVSDMIAYLPQRREEGLRNGTLRELFKEEITKSYEEYVEQIGREVAESTSHFQDALNDLLAGGQRLF